MLLFIIIIFIISWLNLFHDFSLALIICLLVSSEQYREALRESKNSLYDDASPSNTELAAVVTFILFHQQNAYYHLDLLLLPTSKNTFSLTKTKRACCWNSSDHKTYRHFWQVRFFTQFKFKCWCSYVCVCPYCMMMNRE